MALSIGDRGGLVPVGVGPRPEKMQDAIVRALVWSPLVRSLGRTERGAGGPHRGVDVFHVDVDVAMRGALHPETHALPQSRALQRLSEETVHFFADQGGFGAFAELGEAWDEFDAH